MIAPALQSALCACGSPLSLSAVDVATGVCDDCAVIPRMVWAFVERGTSTDLIECNWWTRAMASTPNAVEVAPGQYAVRHYCQLGAERTRFAGETTYDVEPIDNCGQHPDGDTLDAIAHDLPARARRYQGDVVDPSVRVAFTRAVTVVVPAFEAEIAEQRAAAEYRNDCLADAEERAHRGECGEVVL